MLSVDVEPGTAVTAGQTLVRFHAEPERRELEQLEREFELKLVRILLHPDDEATRQSLAALRAARELAAARLRERQVVAPQAGVVRNLRIRPGQLLAPGDVVLTLVDESQAAFTVVALVPGQFRPDAEAGAAPALRAGRLPAGHRRPAGRGGRRRGGGAQRDAPLPGAGAGRHPAGAQGGLVLVRARLPEQTFALDGQRYRYYDGIPGRVDVRVRSVRLLALLFPALKQLAGHGELTAAAPTPAAIAFPRWPAWAWAAARTSPSSSS